MRISEITIHNYRSIRDLYVLCQPLLLMLGPNNHGKSNILSAVEFALSTSAKPTVNEFNCFRCDDNTLWVELTFISLTEQERNTFKKYLRADASIRVRKTARLSETGTVEVSYNGYIQQADEWWLRADSVSMLTKRDEVTKTPLAEMVPDSGRLLKGHIEDAQAQYIDQHRDELMFEEILEGVSFLGQKNIGGGVLPDFYLIPAVRDLADETKIRTTTAFGRLLNRAVREMAERDPRFRKIRDGMEELVKTLNRSVDGKDERPEQLVSLEGVLRSELSSWGVNVDIEVLPPALEKIFELGTNLHIDDGVRTLAEQKGHGLQRAVIFALVRAWAIALRTPVTTKSGPVPRSSSESLVFAMEEPELFLHPHAQRRLAQSIVEIANTPEHQVVVCTHSSHFIDLDRYKNIAVVFRESPETGTQIRQCTDDLFEDETTADRKKHFHMARWVNPDRGEMFFAKRVAFVEGETEKVLFPFLADKLGCLDQDVSIIDCGSKNNLPLYVGIANAFKLSYVVIHDEDALPDPIPAEWSDDKRREKQRTYDLNRDIADAVDAGGGRVEMLAPDFERVAGVSRSQGAKKGKALAALDHFQDMASDDIPERLNEVVRALYAMR